MSWEVAGRMWGGRRVEVETVVAAAMEAIVGWRWGSCEWWRFSLSAGKKNSMFLVGSVAGPTDRFVEGPQDNVALGCQSYDL